MIFQVAYGCPSNSCCFCRMYKGVKYHKRDRNELSAEIRKAGARYPETGRVFLADGNVMDFSFEELKGILEELNEAFPKLARVNVYANGSSILEKSEAELAELHRLKLNTLYMGLESGDEEVLKLIKKSETAADMIKAVNLAQGVGLRCSVMVLLGIGGKKYSRQHVVNTAIAVNLMQPRLLSALRFIEVAGTLMYKEYESITEYEAVSELRELVYNLDLKKTVFRANHASNPVPLGGRFPQDREKLLGEIDYMLRSGRLDEKGPGHVPIYL